MVAQPKRSAEVDTVFSEKDEAARLKVNYKNTSFRAELGTSGWKLLRLHRG